MVLLDVYEVSELTVNYKIWEGWSNVVITIMVYLRDVSESVTARHASMVVPVLRDTLATPVTVPTLRLEDGCVVEVWTSLGPDSWKRDFLSIKIA